jgi:hypothetical protein
METGSFVNISLYVISLIMAAIALLMTIEVIDETIDSEIFLGLGLFIIIAIGIMNNIDRKK